MHQAAYRYVQQTVEGKTFGTVVEFGSRDINGSVRALFDCDDYVGIDLYEGPGVDVVGDAAAYKHDGPVDCVVCCEVFEHLPGWRRLVKAAAKLDAGMLIVTCATTGRTPHSAMDGAQLKAGEYYGNVTKKDLVDACETHGWTVTDVQINHNTHDLYVTATR